MIETSIRDQEEIKEEEDRKNAESEKKKIARPKNEECYSDDDLEFLSMVPEPHDRKYYELFLK